MTIMHEGEKLKLAKRFSYWLANKIDISSLISHGLRNIVSTWLSPVKHFDMQIRSFSFFCQPLLFACYSWCFNLFGNMDNLVLILSTKSNSCLPICDKCIAHITLSSLFALFYFNGSSAH